MSGPCVRPRRGGSFGDLCPDSRNGCLSRRCGGGSCGCLSGVRFGEGFCGWFSYFILRHGRWSAARGGGELLRARTAAEGFCE